MTYVCGLYIEEDSSLRSRENWYLRNLLATSLEQSFEATLVKSFASAMISS